MITLTVKYAKGITVELNDNLKTISIQTIKEENGFYTKKLIGVLDNYVDILEKMMIKYPGAIKSIGVN